MPAKVDLQIDDAQYLAAFTDVRDDRLGNWDWTITAAEVPLRMVDKTVRGSVLIRGRDSAKPTRLQAVVLDEYWSGQDRLTGRWSDK
jgi:hypothetical protein